MRASRSPPRNARRSIRRGTIPAGVPIAAFVFGARRSDTIPLVERSAHLGGGRVQGGDDGLGDHGRGDRRGRRSAARSVRDAAVLRLPHRRLFRALARDGQAVAQPPRIFSVNWFRKDANGKFVWPGFGENMRVLQWIVERCAGARARDGKRGRARARLRRMSTGSNATFDADAVRRGHAHRLARSGSASSPSTTQLFAKLGSKRPPALASRARAPRAASRPLSDAMRARLTPHAGRSHARLRPRARGHSRSRRRCLRRPAQVDAPSARRASWACDYPLGGAIMPHGATSRRKTHKLRCSRGAVRRARVRQHRARRARQGDRRRHRAKRHAIRGARREGPVQGAAQPKLRALFSVYPELLTVDDARGRERALAAATCAASA